MQAHDPAAAAGSVGSEDQLLQLALAVGSEVQPGEQTTEDADDERCGPEPQDADEGFGTGQREHRSPEHQDSDSERAVGPTELPGRALTQLQDQPQGQPQQPFLPPLGGALPQLQDQPQQPALLLPLAAAAEPVPQALPADPLLPEGLVRFSGCGPEKPSLVAVLTEVYGDDDGEGKEGASAAAC